MSKNKSVPITVVGGNDVYNMQSSYSTAQTYSPAGGGTATLDLSLGINHIINMPAGNITIAISNATVGQFFKITIVQDSVGGRTVTWFTTIKWPSAVVPTLSTGANKKDQFGFEVVSAGNYDGVTIAQNL